ncbi:sigma54 specific transcriptional regulator, Fis family [Photobacterium marinum]|uniref:Sigma54 specific transcriptional regulator, Fis family n=1 Tax=Photobacterium marinum TaxID=1056511 RepID=L8JDB3_9GAMM|nr:sigma-54-dependent Fis family transcriptional regulator [Photobacterium marinum]ELR66800.1 sigma54 specific transcriptional regulator, Fis family [Photobacterium marinum]
MEEHSNPLKLTEFTDSILESISDGVFTVDNQWRISFFNRAAEGITGIPRNEALGKRCSEVFKSSMCEADCALRQTLNNTTPIINKSCYIINAEGERIPVSVSTAVLKNSEGQVIGGAETFRDLSEVEALRNALKGRSQVGGFVSHSPLMRNLFELLPAVSASSSNVLIQGETGTGKELLARAVHDMGPRADKPFIAINCGALPDNLLESELFGYKKGAFTGATQDKPGRFALAEGGTLFLDEIGEISPALQVRLLRVLQEHSYEPLGAVKSEQSDVRIIAATHKDLAAMVANGEFRQDLYYRIHVVDLKLPPLRSRKEDIPLLVDQFVRNFNRLQNREVSGVSPEAISFLLDHDWPGNVRELENVIERAFVLCPNGQIGPGYLPSELGAKAMPKDQPEAIGSARQLAEKQSIQESLKRNRFNRAATARELGIHKTTLYRKMKSLQIPFPKQNGRNR